MMSDARDDLFVRNVISFTDLVPTGKFVFSNVANVVLFTIHPDGSIERGPGFTTTDEMSLKFWEAIERMRPRAPI